MCFACLQESLQDHALEEQVPLRRNPSEVPGQTSLEATAGVYLMTSMQAGFRV